MKLPINFFVVRDKSMQPNFFDGDHVVAWRTLRLKIGDAVVIKSEKNLIKRVTKVQEGLVFVDGDNKAESSRVGPFPIEAIVGKVVFKY